STIGRNDPRNTAAALSGLPVIPTVPVPRYKRWAGLAVAKIWPSFSFTNTMDLSGLAKDPKVGEERSRDTRCHKKVTARWYAEFQNAVHVLPKVIGHCTTPTFFFHGNEDPIASPDGTKIIFEMCTAPKQIFLYDARHEPLSEVSCAAAVKAGIRGWFQ